jgi:hypothetical protein
MESLRNVGSMEFLKLHTFEDNTLLIPINQIRAVEPYQGPRDLCSKVVCPEDDYLVKETVDDIAYYLGSRVL